jgi:hypothetical protein
MFHKSCVSDASTDIEEIWYCNACWQKSICQACFQAAPLEGTDEEDEDIPWVACDNCQNWYHIACVRPVNVSKKWLCTICK